jgi:hypothetical protein
MLVTGDTRRGAKGVIGMANVWIFQSRPDKFGLADSLRALDRDNWRVTRYRRRIAPGDRVYVWLCGKDAKTPAGIYAVATVETYPAIGKDNPESVRFGKDPNEPNEEGWKVWLRYDVGGPKAPIPYIPRAAVERAAGGLQVLGKMVERTQFPVTDEEAKALKALVEKHIGRPLPPLSAAEDLTRDECEVCGPVLRLPDGARYCQEHHLKPRSEGGPDHVSNVIVLCPNHHAQFQHGAMAIDPGTFKLASADPAYSGQSLKSHRKFDPECLRHAWERYGGSDGKSPAESAPPPSPETERPARPREEWDEDDWINWDMLPENKKARERMLAAHLARGQAPRARPGEDYPAE